MNERDVFINALQKNPSERSAYLDEACAGNPALRRRIDALLKAYDDRDSFLDSPRDVDATSDASLGQDHDSPLIGDGVNRDDTPVATLAFDLPDVPTSASSPAHHRRTGLADRSLQAASEDR